MAEEEKPGTPETPKNGGFTDNGAQALDEVYKKGDDEKNDPLAAEDQNNDNSKEPSDKQEATDAEGTPDTGQNNYDYSDLEGEPDDGSEFNAEDNDENMPGDAQNLEDTPGVSAEGKTGDEDVANEPSGLVDNSGISTEDQEPEGDGDQNGETIVSTYPDDIQNDQGSSNNVAQQGSVPQSETVPEPEGGSDAQQTVRSNSSSQATRNYEQFNQQRMYEKQQQHKQAQIQRAQRFKRLITEDQPHSVNDAQHANSHGEID